MQIFGSGDRHRIPGVVPPEILIFLHIPKTGGKTMDGVFEHCMPGRYFTHISCNPSPHFLSALRSTSGKCSRRHRRASSARFGVSSGSTLALDVDKIFDRPSKFFTILREPVDRVISHFFYIRQAAHLVSYPFIRHMSLEQYLDSGIGIDANDHGVRVLVVALNWMFRGIQTAELFRRRPSSSVTSKWPSATSRSDLSLLHHSKLLRRSCGFSSASMAGLCTVFSFKFAIKLPIGRASMPCRKRRVGGCAK